MPGAMLLGAALAPGPAQYVLLDAAAADPTQPLWQYGAIGAILIVALYAIRELFKRLGVAQAAAYDREVARADKAEAELAALNTFIRGELVPLLTRSTDAVTKAADVFSERRGDRGPT